MSENEATDTGDIDAEVAALRQKLVRQASCAVLGGTPSESLTASWFGQVLVGLPDEEWPRCEDSDEPLMPLCQINVTELPHRPDSLADIAFITLFIDGEDTPIAENNGDHWLLRAYPSLEGLVALPQPPGEVRDQWEIEAVPMRWEAVAEDFPSRSDVSDLEMSPEAEDGFEERLPNVKCTKVGGWPSMIQDTIYEIDWGMFPEATPDDFEFAFQIDSERQGNWMWGDAGVGYFGRGTGQNKDEWIIGWQCS